LFVGTIYLALASRHARVSVWARERTPKKFLAHHSFHLQSCINYIVQGCPAKHFAPLLDGIVHLFYLWLLLPILRHPCCLYYIKQWICALLIHVLCLLL
jgi:hypothetical protein